jgi:hypothetical protein
MDGIEVNLKVIVAHAAVLPGQAGIRLSLRGFNSAGCETRFGVFKTAGLQSALRVFSLARRSRRRLRNDSCGGCVFAGQDHYSAGCGKQSGERLRIYFFSYREIYRTASAKAADQSSKGLTGEFGGRREVPAHRVVIHRLRTKRVVA